MCGIAGLIGGEPKSISISKLKQSLQHRGPDNFGEYYSNDLNSVSLWHSRLSIIDLKSESNQPFFSFDKRFVIVFNGEIYNHKKLKETLISLGYSFRTDSDTEVLLVAYIKWGVDCLQYLEGMFAFSIWDTLDHILFSARDRFGEKPFYFFNENNIFGFASEIRSLKILFNQKIILDTSTLYSYLKYQNVSFDDTLLKNFKSLLPGHYLIFKNNKIQIFSYWDLTKIFINNNKIKNTHDNLSKLKSIIINSVDKSLESDVPVGIFLSGGVDSSIITAISSKYLKKEISTFSVCFNEVGFLDRDYSRYVAKLYQTKHNEVYVDTTNLEDTIRGALKAVDNPTADGINTWLISRAVKQAGITVAISGVGADEIFGGYSTFDRLFLYNLIPKQFYRIFNFAFESYQKDSSPIYRLLKAQNIFEAYTVNRTFLNEFWIKNLLDCDSRNDLYYKFLERDKDNIKNLELFDQVSYMELMCYMSNVLLKDSDQMSMSNSMEIRSPFLNHKIIEELQNINPEEKFKFRKPKILLKNLFHEDFDYNFWKRPKQGFVMPWDKWMRNDLNSLCEELFDKALKQKIFNASGLHLLRKSFLEHKISWSRYWLVLCLTSWIDSNFKNDIDY